jgi:hypothetical protein
MLFSTVGCATVNPGERGLPYRAFSPGAPPLELLPGVHAKAPWNNVVKYDVRWRVGEQRALEWGDIDWRRREVIIQRNRPSGTNTTGPTKNGKGRRNRLTAELEAPLKRHRHLKGDLVFCARTASISRPISSRTCSSGP